MLGKTLTYVTHRDSTKHYFIRESGYGLSVSIIKELVKKNVQRVLLIEHRKDGSKHSYEANLDQYCTKPTIQEEGFDQQKILAIKEMREIL